MEIYNKAEEDKFSHMFVITSYKSIKKNSSIHLRKNITLKIEENLILKYLKKSPRKALSHL